MLKLESIIFYLRCPTSGIIWEMIWMFVELKKYRESQNRIVVMVNENWMKNNLYTHSWQ